MKVINSDKKTKEKKQEEKQEEKPKTVQRSSVFMFEQQVGYMPMPIDQLYEKAKHAKGLVELCYILHDKDRKEDGTLKTSHYHMSMYFDHRKTVNSVAKMLESKPQQIEVMTQQGQSTVEAKNNAFAYLCHRTKNAQEQGKYQYSPDEVTANFDYPKWLAEQESKVNNANDILELLNDRHITKDQAIERIKNEFGGVAYSRNAKKIETIAYANLRADYKDWLKRMKEKKRDVKVLWLYGYAGTGKSHFATDLATDKNLTYKKLTSKHLFDDLTDLSIKDQDVLIFDDFRPDTLPYSSILQIFDPLNLGVSLDARYHNAYLMSEYIIVTTPFSPYEFYQSMYIRNRKIDTFEQLSRRIYATMHFTTDEIYTVEPKIQRYVDDFPIYKYFETGESIPNAWSQIAVNGGKKKSHSFADFTATFENAVCIDLKDGQKKSPVKKTDENADTESDNLPF